MKSYAIRQSQLMRFNLRDMLQNFIEINFTIKGRGCGRIIIGLKKERKNKSICKAKTPSYWKNLFLRWFAIICQLIYYNAGP